MKTSGRYCLPVSGDTKSYRKRGFAPTLAGYLFCFAVFIALDHGAVPRGPVHTLLTMIFIAAIIFFLARLSWLKE